MDWRQQLLNYGNSLGRATYDDALGVGVEFEDGNDAFWALPGEVFSTVPVPEEGPASAEEFVEAYETIGRVRARAIHAIRHHLAALNVRVDRNGGGQWGLELEGGSSTTMSVGAHLTAVARETNDVYAVVGAAFANHWVRPAPMREQIDQYLNVEGPPANERTIDDGEEREPKMLFPPTIRAVAALMGLCKALDVADERTLKSPAALKRAADPAAGRIGQALLRVDGRLPGVEASIDLLKPA